MTFGHARHAWKGLRFAPKGCHSSPGLKAWGFLAWLINMKGQFCKIFHIGVSVMLIIQLSACGYFLYPERRGQKPVGQIDPAVAVLDALGLLLFIVPGVIAFAVDITNGTLYFPGGQRHSSVSGESYRMTMIRVNPAEL